MSEQNRRRTALKGLAITVPAVWANPIVESVILPAHAQVSPGCRYFSPAASLEGIFGNEGDILPATLWICAECSGDSLRVTSQGSFNNVLRQGDLPLDGGFGILGEVDRASGCEGDFPVGQRARITQIDEGSVTLEVDDSPQVGSCPQCNGFRVVVPAADACGSPPPLTGNCF